MKNARRFRYRGLWLTLLVLPALAGCRGASEPRFFSVRPPEQWEGRLESERQRKNDFFATDAQSPLLAQDRLRFNGLSYWDPDPRYYFAGQPRFYAQPEELEIVTTAGARRPARKVGWMEVPLPDGVQTLQIYQLLDQTPQAGSLPFFVPFRDETSGEETYDAGRYLELIGPLGGPYVLDFNRASNPSCAYGSPERFACPVTPPENRLPVRIEVGEKSFEQDS